MSKGITLKANIRAEINGKAKEILNQGYVPAVLYGAGIENIILKVKKHDLEHAYHVAGESNLINLIVEEQEPAKALIKDVQRSGVKNSIIHADFYKVNMKKKITIEIPLNFIGESKAVKELGGTLIKSLDTVEVECLPGNIVKEIDIDLSKLKELGDVIKLSDLKMPEDIEIVSQEDLIVASAIEPKEEKEEVKQAIPAEAEAVKAEAVKEGEGKNKE